MAVMTGQPVVDLLVEAGIITNPNNVTKVVLTFGVGGAVTAEITQFVDRPVLETIIRRLGVVDE